MTDRIRARDVDSKRQTETTGSTADAEASSTDGDQTDGGGTAAETASREMRNEWLREHGLGHLLESRVIGAPSPLERTDEEVADRAAEWASRAVVGAYLDKAADAVTSSDFLRLEEMKLEQLADAIHGKPLSELDDIERMRLTSEVRNARFEATVAEAARARDAAGTAESAGGNASEPADAASTGSVRGSFDDVVAPGFRSDSGGTAPGVGSFIGAGSGAGSGASDAAGSTAGTAGAGAGVADDVATDGSSLGQAASGISGSLGSDVASDTAPGPGANTGQPGVTDGPTTDAAAGTNPSDSDTTPTSTPTTPTDTGSTSSTGRGTSSGSNQQTTTQPSAPAENAAVTDYGQGQSMPAYDDEGFVGSLAGPEDYSHGTSDNGIWYLVYGNGQDPHYHNPTTGQSAVWSGDAWVDATTGEPVGALNKNGSSSGSSAQDDQSNSTQVSEASAETATDTASESSSDDDDDDDDDDEGGVEVATADTGGGDTSSDSEDGAEPGGAMGTPNPELTYVSPGARAAWESTPIGAADRRTSERGVEDNAPGAGLIDPVDDGGGRGDGGGPLRFVGGVIDPLDGLEQRAAAQGPLDEMALPNAGLIDPIDDAPTGGDLGGTIPLGGGVGPIVGGVRSSAIDGLHVAGLDADLLDDEVDGAAADPIAGVHGLSDIANATVGDLPTHEGLHRFTLDADDLSSQLDLGGIDDAIDG